MSHIITSEIKVSEQNLRYLRNAVEEDMKGEWMGEGTARLFSETVRGNRFKLPGWKYPVVVTDKGDLQYDNYDGNWGEQEYLDQTLQHFVRRTILASAKKQGYRQMSQKMNAKGQMEVVLTCN